MSVISKVRARAKTLTADEWIISLVTAAIILPEYAFAVIVCLTSLYALIHPVKRSGMMEQPGFFVSLILLPLVIMPVAISGNVKGLLYGAVLWLIIMFMYYVSSVMTRRFLGNILDLLLMISVVASVFGVMDRFFIGTTHDGVLRTTSIFANANHYGYAIEIFSVVAVGRFMKKKKPIYLVLALINVASLILCDCRTAWAAIGAAIVVMLLFNSRSWKAIAITGVAGVVCCAAAYFVLPMISPRFEIARILVSYNNRADMWENAIGWIKENPVFGYGTASYEMLSVKNGVRELKHAHNLPLNMVLDYGIIGSAVFVVLFSKVLKPIFVRSFRNKYNYVSSIVLGTLTATIIHGMVDVPILGVSTAYLLIMVISSSAIERNEASYGYAIVAAKKGDRTAAQPIGVGAAAGGYSFGSVSSSAMRKSEYSKLYTMSNDGKSMSRF